MSLALAPILLALLAVAVVVGGVSAARFRGRRWPTGAVRQREGRRVTCRGRVVCSAPLKSPVTGQTVLAYRVEVYATWTDGERQRTRRVEAYRRVAPHSIDDGTGPLPVRPGPDDRLFPERVSFDQSRSISLARSVTGRPEAFGAEAYPVSPDIVAGGVDSARVVEKVVPVPEEATAIGEVRAGTLVGGRRLPLWVDGTARTPMHALTEWLLPAIGQRVLRGARRLVAVVRPPASRGR